MKPSACEKSIVSLPPLRSPPRPKSPCAWPEPESQDRSLAAKIPRLSARTPMPPAMPSSVNLSPGSACWVMPMLARPCSVLEGCAAMVPGGRSSMVSPAESVAASSASSCVRGVRSSASAQPPGISSLSVMARPRGAGPAVGAIVMAKSSSTGAAAVSSNATGIASAPKQVGQPAQQLATVEAGVAPAEQGLQRRVRMPDHIAELVEAQPARQMGAWAALVRRPHAVDDAGEAERGLHHRVLILEEADHGVGQQPVGELAGKGIGRCGADAAAGERGRQLRRQRVDCADHRDHLVRASRRLR